jgi:surface antigen
MTDWRLILIGVSAVVAGCTVAGHQPDITDGTVAGQQPEITDAIVSPVAVQARQTALQTLPSGGVEQWYDATAGTRGSVTVVNTYKRPDGQWCRLIDETVEPGNGSSASIRSLYCREPAGVWVLTAAG